MEYDERWFEAVFNDPNMLVGVLDTDGIVEAVNDTALAYTDVDRGRVVGEPFAETPWWGDDLREDVEAWIADAAAGEYVEYETEHSTGDGDVISVQGSFRPVLDEGDIVGIVASAKDVTERVEREHELQERTAQLDQFASFVSHDLQSPISAVRGRLQLALQTGDDEHIEKAMGAIERVDELRDDFVRTLRSGDIVSEREPVDIEAALGGVWSETDPPETASYTVEGALLVEADPDAFQRLLENLVGNSVEHSSTGNRAEPVDSMEHGSAGNEPRADDPVEHAGDGVEVLVGDLDDGFYYEDDGPGIDPSHREQVFVPGFSTKSGTEGIGMGMASVRQIVDAHDWEIDIDDAEHLDGVRFEIHTDASD